MVTLQFVTIPDKALPFRDDDQFGSMTSRWRTLQATSWRFLIELVRTPSAGGGGEARERGGGTS